MNDVDVLIVGGGIAGWSAAWCASHAGREVVVVDEGLHRCSDLPVALINPLRGHRGRVVADGIDGMHATFALIDRLRDAGHRIVANRGLYRPLIDLPEAASSEAFWRERIGERAAQSLAFDWHARAPASLGLAASLSGSVPALYIRDAGRVEPASLLAALRADSGATLLVDRVTALATCESGDVAGGAVVLASGSTLRARSLLWCGGAWGAALIDRETQLADEAIEQARRGSFLPLQRGGWEGNGVRPGFDSAAGLQAGSGSVPLARAPGPSPTFPLQGRERDDAPPLKEKERGDALYKPGSLVAVDGRLTEASMSFGLYVAPMPDHATDAPCSLIGPTREGSCASFPEGTASHAAVRHLEDRIARVFGRTVDATEIWRGVRLARLSSASQRVLQGVPTLTALGSRGFLMAPLLASRWAASL